jgi:hypothetical protein
MHYVMHFESVVELHSFPTIFSAVGNAVAVPGFAQDLGYGDPGVSYSMLPAPDAAGALTAGILLESVAILRPRIATALLFAGA